jgi:D-amino-acid dehydrogenase
MSDHEAVVVGGGIVGAAVAYHLARAGTDTLLVDRGHEGRATDAGAGIVSPATSSRSGSDTWFEFAVGAARYYPTLAERLEADGVADHGFAERALLCVALSPDEREAFEEKLAQVRARADRVGYPDLDAVAELSAAEARERFPALGDVAGAFVYEDAARVNGREFCAALRRAGAEHGLDELDATVERVRVDGGEATGVVADGERIDADAVVVAGGAWSGAFADDLGVSVPVEPQRGQIAHLDVDADTADWPLVTGFRGHYMVPWDDGRVAAGATRETESGFEPTTTAAGVHEVLGEALAAAPGLGAASLREVRVGLRPATPDGLPVLGGVPGVEGAYLATGHGPTGLQLGPYSAKLVAERVRGEAPEDDPLAPMAPSRFD